MDSELNPDPPTPTPVVPEADTSEQVIPEPDAGADSVVASTDEDAGSAKEPEAEVVVPLPSLSVRLYKTSTGFVVQ